MEELATLRRPPLVKTELTPNEIVGYDNMPIFKAHLKICLQNRYDSFPDAKLDKEIGMANRKRIAEILQHLRDNGFYPLGIHKDSGKVEWGIATMSAVQELFDSGLYQYENKPIGELQKMARTGYLTAMKYATVPEVEDYEINR